MKPGVDPKTLGIKGSTQPEVFEGTVDGMVTSLLADPDRFWAESTAKDGPIEIWKVSGELWLANGNHRFQAAIRAGLEIPNDFILRDMTSSPIATFPMETLTWMPGCK